jgi:dipeptidyl-peptidase-4
MNRWDDFELKLPMRFLFVVVLWATILSASIAQDRLPTMPRYDRYSRLAKEISTSVVSGGATVRWSDDSESFFYSHAGKEYKYDLSTKTAEETTEQPKTKSRTRSRRGAAAPDRGRQFSIVMSPNGKLKAQSALKNVTISDLDDKNPVVVTTDGSESTRIKYGVASWVYGEELGVKNAMWWSPDSSQLAYYRFDESQVKDYYVTLDEGAVQDRLNVEPYPKAGAPNPRVSLFIYDLKTKISRPVDVGFGDSTLAEYIYDVRWSDDGRQLFFNRTNRKQNVMQFCSADPGTGVCRMIVEEKQPQSWAENHPVVTFLKDGNRFIWASERDGFKNFYLYDLSGVLLSTLTSNRFDALRIDKVDEEKHVFYYTAYGANDPLFRQLHRCGLDGKRDVTLTSPDLDHDVTLSPNSKWIVDVAQSPSYPAETRLLDAKGKKVDTVLKSDMTKFEALGLKKTEIFHFKAADEKTDLYGSIQYPSDFDPNEKYPVLLTVYGGPESGGLNPRFQTPNPITELGFLVVNIAGRGTQGRGKAFRDVLYEHLGSAEIDDQNAGIRSLSSRSYVDLARVGVFGTSYGGYSTCMLMLRHPETFAVGCASSSVTSWLNYDSIYTERFMGLPTAEDNAAGYEKSAAMTYVGALRGKLMLYFGSADNNVHPSNTYQLTQALERAGKSYDMTVGTDKGHTQMNSARMWEYFVTHLIVHPHENALDFVWKSRKLRPYAPRRSSKKA